MIKTSFFKSFQKEIQAIAAKNIVVLNQSLSTTSKLQKIKLFLPFLLAPLLKWPYFYSGFFETVGLAIDKTESKGKEIIVEFSEYSL